MRRLITLIFVDRDQPAIMVVIRRELPHDMDSPCSYGIGCARLKTVDRSITEQGESR
jgi:hypothetical protein